MRQILFDRFSAGLVLGGHITLALVLCLSPPSKRVSFAVALPLSSASCQSSVRVKTLPPRQSSSASVGAAPCRPSKPRPSPSQSVKPSKQKTSRQPQKTNAPKSIKHQEKESKPVGSCPRPRKIAVGAAKNGVWEQGGVDMRKLIRSVYATVHASWRPPSGVAPGTTAQVILDIDARGYVQRVVFEKRSGVLLFDQSIQLALRSWRFCKRLCNSSLTLDLIG